MSYKMLEIFLQGEERRKELNRLKKRHQHPVFDEAKMQERTDYLTNTEDIDCGIVEPKLLNDKQ
jgi:hypothetical protein